MTSDAATERVLVVDDERGLRRALEINLSREFESHLENVVRQRRAEQWKRDNREAIEAYNRHIERDGLWNEEFRTF